MDGMQRRRRAQKTSGANLENADEVQALLYDQRIQAARQRGANHPTAAITATMRADEDGHTLDLLLSIQRLQQDPALGLLDIIKEDIHSADYKVHLLHPSL